MDAPARPLFPNYMERRQWLPVAAWHALRCVVLLAVGGLVWLCFARPALALSLFWGIAIPMLPLVFFAVPGLWRNLCPLAASNQLPRLLGLSRGWTLPPKLRRYSVLIGLALLFGAVGLRRPVLDHDAGALAVLLLAALGLALVGGLLFKGKSGWCGSFCPLLPVQRLYGQTPFAVVSNSHCQPCVGCTRNCYDFNPQVAWLADLHDDETSLGTDRRLLAGMLPGLVLAYYGAAPAAEAGLAAHYLRYGLYCLVGIGAYWLAEAVLRQSAQRLTAAFAAGTLVLYYWFAAPVVFASVARLSAQSLPVEAMAWALRVTVLVLALLWLLRTVRKETLFLAQSFVHAHGTQANPQALASHQVASAKRPVVTLEPGHVQLAADPGVSLLALLEANECAINAGCRMGACGADPVAIVSGAASLSPCSDRERDTLARQGYGDGVRLACSARVHGPVVVNLDPRSAGAGAPSGPGMAVPGDVRSIVIIGSGIAGVTAADVIRRHWPVGELHLVGAERYPLYNRMAIAKLIHGRSAMQGLLLMPERWYEERNITTWLNTRVRAVDVAARQVALATGERLDFDRLLITAGSRAFVPRIEGFDRPGCFVLREAEDAMAIREYVQAHGVRSALVAGGGLLGLEAAYALLQLGLRVRVLERSDGLLSRQLDAGAGARLAAYLSGLGLQLEFGHEVVVAQGSPALERVGLADGSSRDADLLLVAAGIVPNAALAQAAGLDTGRGIIVDERMQTTAAGVFAAGDAAEWRGAPGQVPGLWTVAVEQGRIAAMNALGGNERYAAAPQPTALKVAGVDLLSVGQFQPGDGDEAVVVESGERYRKLVLRDGRLRGAILLGHPEFAESLVASVVAGRDVATILPALRLGDWSGLERSG
ncbi:MAG: FAD-dependent oxidoreductase [Arenimonas sp.]|nr:FAD-dependent oxidoreductase [Arenimonas sp.]